MLADEAPDHLPGAPYDDLAAQRALMTRSLAQQRRQRQWYLLRLAAVWAALFAVLGAILYLFNLDYGYMLSNAGFVLAGLGITVGVSLVSILIASIIALFGALARLSTHATLSGIAGFYVSVMRGTPLLVQIYIIYLGLPQIGQQLTIRGYPQLGQFFILTALQSGILALSLNYGAYMTEIFRAGIQSIPHGQWEAALALGMRTIQTLRYVILPQAMRLIIPAIGNQFIAMQKDSSLVSVMGIWEVTYRANRMARKESMFIEMFLLAAAIYWVLTIVSEQVQARLERRMARSEHL